ncbi:unnamed protein product [Gordionus sp. m RMFG-2023]
MNSDCETYTRYNSYACSVYSYLIPRVIPYIKERDNILDLGCGEGKSTNLLYKTLLTTHKENEFEGNVLGIDLLSPMIEYAKEHYSSANERSLKFSNIDISSEDAVKTIFNAVKGEFIDCVVSSLCFHWIEDQTKALANLLKVINPKVGSIKMIYGDRVADNLVYATERVLNNQELSPYLKKFKELHENLLLPWRRAWMLESDPISSYKKIMVDLGYDKDKIKIEQLDEINYSIKPSQEAATNYLRGFFPDVLAEIDKAGLREQFFKQFAENVFDYNQKHYGDKLKFYYPLMYVRYN